MPAPNKRASVADAAEDRRKQILEAAVQVFAERGFHRTRVSDIAKRAGVAYGLVYHYFESKDAVLNAVFETNWSVFLKVLRELRSGTEPASALEKLRCVSDLLLDALEVAPAIMQVVIQEVSRSDRFVEAEKLGAFREGFELVGAIIVDGQERGELRPDVDPMVTAHAFFGALETVCTGVMLGQIARDPEQVARVRHTVHAVLLDGLRPEDRRCPPGEPRERRAFPPRTS